VPWAMFCLVCQEDADRMLSRALDEHILPLPSAA
jgi:hypothetical protein